MIGFLGEVKGFVKVDVFDTVATLCKILSGDIVFDKGVDAVRIAGVADVDDHAEAIRVDSVDNLHVGFEGLCCLVFGGEGDIEVVGGVEEFGDGFGAVIFESEVGDVDGGTHFGGEANGGEGVCDDLLANGFIRVVVWQGEGAVD